MGPLYPCAAITAEYWRVPGAEWGGYSHHPATIGHLYSVPPAVLEAPRGRAPKGLSSMRSQSTRVQRVCAYCSTPFSVKASRAARPRGGLYCSAACRASGVPRGSRLSDDLTGQRFARLVVTGRAANDSDGAVWRCACDCGRELLVRGGNLRSGNTRSCGCLYEQTRGTGNRSHGRTNTSAYWRWRAMIQRCTNPRNRGWADYGGRGIRVCERWRTFAEFYADMGDPPPGASIDRIDVDGNYEPSNCRWATANEQARNKRNTPALTFGGETLSLIEWSERLGIDFHTLHSRLKRGWSTERALTTAVRRG